MVNFFVVLLLISYVQFNVVNSVSWSDHDFDVDLERLQNGQQSSQNQTQHPKRFIQSCDEARVSGVYELRLSSVSEPFTAFCDVDSLYGKWLVVQQRLDGSVDFNRSWAEYRDGFGTVGESTEFWFGLEKIYQLTTSGQFELVIELKNEKGEYGFARYDEFGIAAENESYQLNRLGNHRGSISDNLYHQRGLFQTYVRNMNCYEKYSGGWWFNDCEYSHLNGPYTAAAGTGKGIYWNGWTNAAKFSRMMVRRKQKC